jgi:hypothetical protein|tara:strand:+ start:415 stop:636 length:222 start_codon:yes stop_codon:yes gene_type:complete
MASCYAQAAIQVNTKTRLKPPVVRQQNRANIDPHTSIDPLNWAAVQKIGKMFENGITTLLLELFTLITREIFV